LLKRQLAGHLPSLFKPFQFVLKMKYSSKNGKQIIATLFFLLALVVGSFSASMPADCSCATPTSVVKTFQSSTAVSFTWQGSGTYSLWYVRKSDGAVGQAVTPNGNAVSFTGMQPGTYTIYSLTSCTGGPVEYIIWDDLIIC
jgi:hypothetical protein